MLKNVFSVCLQIQSLSLKFYPHTWELKQFDDEIKYFSY